jgi:hypothetical protein
MMNAIPTDLPTLADIRIRQKEKLAQSVQEAVERSMKAVSEQNRILAEELASLSQLLDIQA